MNTKDIRLDVSELEAPYPLVEGVKALNALKEGETLIFIHRMNPCKFFEQIEKKGLNYKIIRDEDNYFEMKIFKGD